MLTLMRYYSSVQQREKIEEVYQRASEYVRGTLGVDMCDSIEEMYCYYLLMTPKKLQLINDDGCSFIFLSFL
ncbi:hypothetical protein BN1050_00991 [Metalysinibacillus saudimassiliensis]|uniref:Uncharacterized protein n=1 Tax=Metalysinibacillus saudimassiliensis TaxID=1461583 RepID=A0A078M2R6_9BACL|nr:hypothetical protein BN1050_00991 [Metalysinibacillus saudimassiliensis]